MVRFPEVRFALSTYYAKTIDRLGLLDTLGEDGLFGAHTFTISQRRVSRDLLDSVLEIAFLEQTLGLSKRAGLTVLDVGAGYGRFAHRLAEGLPSLARVFCVDAVPESTFVSEYYLGFRGVAEKAEVVELGAIESVLEHHRVDLAVNMHSFTECSPEAVRWWVELLSKHDVRHLFIQPGQGGLKAVGRDRELVDFSGDLAHAGYKLMIRAPKYSDPLVRKWGLFPDDYYLFEKT